LFSVQEKESVMKTCPQKFQAAKANPREAIMALRLDEHSSQQTVYDTLEQVSHRFGACLTGLNDPRVVAVYRCLRGQPHEPIVDWVLCAVSNRESA
jgi:hypothetical protein